MNGLINIKKGLINPKNDLSRYPSVTLGITGLQPEYRF
jgi:hypothetical protein